MLRAIIRSHGTWKAISVSSVTIDMNHTHTRCDALPSENETQNKRERKSSSSQQKLHHQDHPHYAWTTIITVFIRSVGRCRKCTAKNVATIFDARIVQTDVGVLTKVTPMSSDVNIRREIVQAIFTEYGDEIRTTNRTKKIFCHRTGTGIRVHVWGNCCAHAFEQRTKISISFRHDEMGIAAASQMFAFKQRRMRVLLVFGDRINKNIFFNQIDGQNKAAPQPIHYRRRTWPI